MSPTFMGYDRPATYPYGPGKHAINDGMFKMMVGYSPEDVMAQWEAQVKISEYSRLEYLGKIRPVYPGEDLTECLLCGSVLGDPLRHMQFHGVED